METIDILKQAQNLTELCDMLNEHYLEDDDFSYLPTFTDYEMYCDTREIFSYDDRNQISMNGDRFEVMVRIDVLDVIARQINETADREEITELVVEFAGYAGYKCTGIEQLFDDDEMRQGVLTLLSKHGCETEKVPEHYGDVSETPFGSSFSDFRDAMKYFRMTGYKYMRYSQCNDYDQYAREYRDTSGWTVTFEPCWPDEDLTESRNALIDALKKGGMSEPDIAAELEDFDLAFTDPS